MTDITHTVRPESRHAMSPEATCCGLSGLPAAEIQDMLAKGDFGPDEDGFRDAINALRSDAAPEGAQCSGACWRIHHGLQEETLH